MIDAGQIALFAVAAGVLVVALGPGIAFLLSGLRIAAFEQPR